MNVDTHTIEMFLARHPLWTFADDALHTTMRFPTFRDAIAAINTLGVLAEDADHHPDMTNSYTTLTIRLTSHDTGAVTKRDLALAEAIDTAFDR